MKFECEADKEQRNHTPPHGPRIRRASWISRCMIVTRFAWIAQRFLNKFSQTL